MILLSVDDLVKHYGPQAVLDGVSFEIASGERVGLVGPNGVGKTTLFKILAGREEADSGRVAVHSSVKIEYLEQQPELAAGRTLWEDASRGLAELAALNREAESVAHLLAEAADAAERKRLAERFERLQYEIHRQDAYTLEHKIERVLEGLGFSREQFTQSIETLSGGQQNRLMLARLLLAGADLMLLDEPSNHLDIEATEWLESFLVESRQSVLVVSHDRYLLDKVTTRTLELFRGTVESFPGNFSHYWRLKAERVKVAGRTYDRQRELIAKTEDFIRKNHYGQKHQQAKDREKKLARIERVEPPREIVGPVMGFPKADRTGDIVLRVEHLSKGFGRPLFADLSFDILRGDRWGILGPNGTGKTTLLRCIVGEHEPDSGEVILGQGVRIGYGDQLMAGFDEATQVVESIRPPGKEFTEPQRRDMLARFGLTGDQVFQTVGSLSGGERNRAALARLAATDANFLVLDEPTNHLDLWARDSLERSLAEFNGTVLFVSHDRYFLNRVADHLLVVEPGRFRTVEGNYETYLHLVLAGLAGAGAGQGPKRRRGEEGRRRSLDATDDETMPRRKRRFPYRKLTDIEREIAERETRLAELTESLSQSDVYRDGRRVREVQAAVEDEKRALSALYEHWEESLELNEIV